MRTYDDSFSGARIYPGKGKLFIRNDSKIFRFQNGKSESLALQRKNPRRIAWTVLCRQQRRKGAAGTGDLKRRRRKQITVVRGAGGASSDHIIGVRTQKPAARKLTRDTAVEELKAKRTAQKAEAKKHRAQGGANASQVSKKQARGNAPKPAATSR